MNSRLCAAVVSSTTILLCAALTGPALASDEAPAPSASTPGSIVNTAPPEEPEEDVTEISDGPVGEPADDPIYPGKPEPVISPDAVDCSPAHAVYVPTSQGKQFHQGVGPTNANYNATSRTAESTFTSEVTGEVGVSVSGDLETSVNTMLVKIKAKFNVTVSAKLTAKLGN
ncbi:hypothetical protein JS756_12975 [Streptomyces actuosus]|uniref:Uncharacterized protein n=1 Tax=Streptomyces actuosus TaxID=1885 RepID=A0ABS2VPL7_STRAS|nr:hypothetical protein [Streptomyces actuosus]MBN0045006.1 hypothetical protein [Streptomyces actuosus]